MTSPTTNAQPRNLMAEMPRDFPGATISGIDGKPQLLTAPDGRGMRTLVTMHRLPGADRAAIASRFTGRLVDLTYNRTRLAGGDRTERVEVVGTARADQGWLLLTRDPARVRGMNGLTAVSLAQVVSLVTAD